VEPVIMLRQQYCSFIQILQPYTLDPDLVSVVSVTQHSYVFSQDIYIIV